jgi:ribosomal protein L11
MEAIIGVLKEELNNSKRLLKNYNLELKKLPKGSLVKKKIHHQNFYYLAYREDKKVVFEYKGKLSKDEIHQIEESKKKRLQYKSLMKDLKRQIRFLENALRGN